MIAYAFTRRRMSHQSVLTQYIEAGGDDECLLAEYDVRPVLAPIETLQRPWELRSVLDQRH